MSKKNVSNKIRGKFNEVTKKRISNLYSHDMDLFTRVIFGRTRVRALALRAPMPLLRQHLRGHPAPPRRQAAHQLLETHRRRRNVNFR